jgi:hypothetical protein
VGSLFPSVVPVSRGLIFHTLHVAVRDTWGGAALDAVVAALPADVARATIGPEFVALRWYPTSHLMAWQAAIFEVSARGSHEEYAACIDRSLDVSIGVVRRLFMKVVTPRAIGERAAEMWRHFHSQGKVEIDWRSETSGRITLADHPYAQDALGRHTFAEMIRYMLALSRAKDVRESHGLDGSGRVAVTASWRM